MTCSCDCCTSSAPDEPWSEEEARRLVSDALEHAAAEFAEDGIFVAQTFAAFDQGLAMAFAARDLGEVAFLCDWYRARRRLPEPVCFC